jgi:hypothetical protein
LLFLARNAATIATPQHQRQLEAQPPSRCRKSGRQGRTERDANPPWCGGTSRAKVDANAGLIVERYEIGDRTICGEWVLRRSARL